METRAGSSVRTPAGTATRIVRAAAALAFSAALAGAAAPPATTADTLSTLVVSSGSLGFSSAPASVSFGLDDPGAAAAMALQGVTVNDNRAGTAGWSASLALTDFTGNATGAALSSTGATYTPTAATTTGTVTVTASTATDPTTPRIVQTATGVSGNNTATWNASLTVPVPNDAVVDTYTATLTYSIS
ncbi:hypothetical protein AU252_15405 [Pseudarthrobacter sulfonivorans]|uniref:WxL domain-containing protein n=1 Tax=Pseudarthrobacter sulfonivorans TaxID=121292 RepID=A0A0U3FF30_9MICC|nr:hypothetical protein [Pseudarthrobacter sulfonivorans]ALV42361.1 hypothetical protein AU252_15405 [Pseudarthrobacter sulfonivorans]